MAHTPERFFCWIFIVGTPSESDINYMFDNEILAYILPEYSIVGEC